MIPKTIHYCWFGKGEKTELMKKCIASWEKILPDYEIIEWNESNFDLNKNRYVKEAYETKKYAFVTDYVRLYVLFNHGGIYMDTDVEVLKPLDEFLKYEAFSGFESNNYIPTGIIGAKKKNKWIKLLMEEYDNISFIKDNNELDLTTNTVRITNRTIKNYNVKLNGSLIDLEDIIIFPHDYFCPKDFLTGKINLTKNTYTIHHFSGSWHSKKEQKQIEKRKYLVNKYGEDLGMKKYTKYLNKAKVLNYFTYPFKAIVNPKKALDRLRGKNEI